MFCLIVACDDLPKTIAVWLMEQTEGLLFVMSVCMYACVNRHGLQIGANPRLLESHCSLGLQGAKG